jgi:hypothetical protein
MVFQAHFYRVADAHADEWPGHFLIECPVTIGSAVGEVACHLDGFQVDFDAPRPTAANWRREVSRIAHDGDWAIRLCNLADLVRRQDRPICRLRTIDARFLWFFRSSCRAAQKA